MRSRLTNLAGAVAIVALLGGLPACGGPDAPVAPIAPADAAPAEIAPGIAPELAPVDAAPDKAAARPATRPNVLLVMTDDMRHDDLRWMPNVQSFVRDRGTDFRNSFAPTPLCCPNRASYLTGKLPHNHHVWWHEAPWGYGSFDDRRTLATALQGAGYRTGYIGKYLNQYGIARPFADRSAAPSTYVPHGWTDWRGTPDATPYGPADPREGSTYDFWDTTVNNNGVLEGNPGEYNSTVLVDETIEVLDRFSAQQRPWYIQLNSLAPHHGAPVEADDPYLETAARPEWVRGKFDDVITRAPGIPANGKPEADTSDKAFVTRRLGRTGPAARAAVLKVARQRAESLFVLDKELGRLFKRLRATGELDNTIVAFTSDNGYMLGEHRWVHGKVIGFEASYRVPLVIAGPGIPAGAKHYGPISSVDLTASMLQWTGARLRGVDGTGIVGELGRGVSGGAWSRAVGYESYFPGIPNPHTRKGFRQGPRTGAGIRTAQWFYVRYSNGDAELFDLAKDPLELTSVHADPSYAAVRRDLDRVWRRFANCRGADCTIPLPPSLRTSGKRTTELTELMERETVRYYLG